MGLVLAMGVGGWVALSLTFLLLAGATVVAFVVFPVSIWWKSKISGAPIPISKLYAMKLRGVNLEKILAGYITAKKSGLKFDVSELETHILAGGNIDNVVRAMISAKSAGLQLNLQMAKALDLAGKDIYEIVQTCIVPKTVKTEEVVAVAKDDIEVKAKADITILANIKRVIGGADESTVISRVSEALSSTIGSAVSHMAVLENPDVISDAIMNKNLDEGTMYEILSIDIYEMKIGKNYAHQKRLEQAELDKKKSQTELEERRLLAVAKEQEAKVKAEEAKLKAIEAEAELPKALLKALNEGKLSAVDYYDIQNLQADTKLRNMISGNTSSIDKKEGEQTGNPFKNPKPRKNPFNF